MRNDLRTKTAPELEFELNEYGERHGMDGVWFVSRSKGSPDLYTAWYETQDLVVAVIEGTLYGLTYWAYGKIKEAGL